MPPRSRYSLAQRVEGAISRFSKSKAQTASRSPRQYESPINSGSVANGQVNRQSILEVLGIGGCEAIQPLIVASLVTEDPVLLIGPHGTGKSFLLNQISAALGIEWRHYNASILNFDDLTGFPVPTSDWNDNGYTGQAN